MPDANIQPTFKPWNNFNIRHNRLQLLAKLLTTLLHLTTVFHHHFLLRLCSLQLPPMHTNVKTHLTDANILHNGVPNL